MEIDPFTVGAQVVNFLVLVVLLRRFLYGPVTRAMDRRESEIAARLEEAARARRDADAEAERLRAANADLDGSREHLLAEARDDAGKQRKELLAEARADADRQRQRWHEAIEREKEALLDELERRALERVHAIARRALRELADEELEQRIARVFLRRLDELGPEAWARVGADRDDEEPRAILVTSAFPLPDDLRGEIADRVRSRVGADAGVRFEVDQEAIAGIELRTHGLRVAWSLGDFVDSLEDLFPGSGPVDVEVPAP